MFDSLSSLYGHVPKLSDCVCMRESERMRERKHTHTQNIEWPCMYQVAATSNEKSIKFFTI